MSFKKVSRFQKVNQKGVMDASSLGAIPSSEKAVADGVATLDSNAKIPVAQIPDEALGNVEVFADIASRDAFAQVDESVTCKVLDFDGNGNSAWYKYDVDTSGWLEISNSDLTSILDDALTSTSKGWSSQKIQDELDRKVTKSFGRYIRAWSNGSTSNNGNHYLEIQAIGTDGNVLAGDAFSMDTAGNATGGAVAMLTDGVTTTNPYHTVVSAVRNGIILDLGSIQEISRVKLWRYYLDGRSYLDTMVEISENGTDWVVIQDSAVDGIYPETAEGKTIFVADFGSLNKLVGKEDEILAHLEDTERHLSEEQIAKLAQIQNQDPESPSLVPSNWFPVANGSPASSYPEGWGQGLGSGLNGSANENEIYYDDGTNTPTGNEGHIWRATSNTPNGTNGGADGGVNGGYFPVDRTKKHRVLVWFKKNSGTTLTDGTIYLGTRAKNSSGTPIGLMNADNGANNTNFYGFYGDALAADTWYLAVFVIHPEGTPADGRKEGGIYALGSTQEAMPSIRDAIFQPDTAELMQRFYLYYSTENGNSADFYAPRFEVMDGTEVPLATLLQTPESELSEQGVILPSPDGTRWEVSVDNSGNLITTAL